MKKDDKEIAYPQPTFARISSVPAPTVTSPIKHMTAPVHKLDNLLKMSKKRSNTIRALPKKKEEIFNKSFRNPNE